VARRLPVRVRRGGPHPGVAADARRRAAGGSQFMAPVRRVAATGGIRRTAGTEGRLPTRTAPVFLAGVPLAVEIEEERPHRSRQLRDVGDDGRQPIFGGGANRWVGLHLTRRQHSPDCRRSCRGIERRPAQRLAGGRNAGVRTRHGRTARLSDGAGNPLWRTAPGRGVPSGSPPSRRQASCAGVQRCCSEPTAYKEGARKAKQLFGIHTGLPDRLRVPAAFRDPFGSGTRVSPSKHGAPPNDSHATPLRGGADQNPGETKVLTRALTAPYGNSLSTRKLSSTCGDTRILLEPLLGRRTPSRPARRCRLYPFTRRNREKTCSGTLYCAAPPAPAPLQ
jgi:hypothetical protein